MLDGARLIAIHKTRYYKRPDGLALGPGPFVAALEFASGKEADVVGKPDKNFYQMVQQELGCPLAETVMIGDVRLPVEFDVLTHPFLICPLLQDVVNDIHGAQVLGMKGLLVKTGQ